MGRRGRERERIAHSVAEDVDAPVVVTRERVGLLGDLLVAEVEDPFHLWDLGIGLPGLVLVLLLTLLRTIGAESALVAAEKKRWGRERE